MRTKTITLNERQYQLRRMKADVAAFIYMRMMGAIMRAAADTATAEEQDPPKDAPKPSDEQRARLLCTLAMMKGLSFEDVQFTQSKAMQTVDVVEPEAGPIPVMSSDGRWADQVLAEDPALVNQLTLEALAFNLASFFAERNGIPTT